MARGRRDGRSSRTGHVPAANQFFGALLAWRGCQSVLRRRRPFRQTRTLKLGSGFRSHEHPVVAPQVMHLRQVPLRTRVKLPHSEHESPS